MALRVRLAAAALLTAAVMPALAQTTPPLGGSRQVIPENRAEPLHSGRSEGQNLSKDLSKSDGVIKPKENVDPGMKAPAPDPNPHSTPVIPPSATGGQNAK